MKALAQTTWNEAYEVVTRLLNEHFPEEFELTPGGFYTFSAPMHSIIVEITGTPWKPEYWINDVRVSMLEHLPAAIESCKEDNEYES